jgi:phosphohistidine phosphatase
MKKIHLLRHAKSSWKNVLLDDIHRPLNHRGISSCELMASQIVDTGCEFINVFCSPAVRAQSTIELLNRSIPSIKVHCQTDVKLYCFDSASLHFWFAVLDESVSEVMIIGHNPALTDFCNELSDTHINNIPTCGYAQLTAHTEFNWLQISDASFELTHFVRPKKLMRG